MRENPLQKSPLSSQRGFIVVIAMWILAALAALTMVASVYIVQSANALSPLDIAPRWEMLSSAGVELVAYDLSRMANGRRPTRGGFRFRLTDSQVSVEYVSESARIDLNAAPRAMIAGIFQATGMAADAADQLADRVAAWRSPAETPGENEETALYRAAGLNYLPRRGPFNSTEELWLLAGMPPSAVERVLPFVTVYSEMAGVNVLDAAPEVLAALPDMTPARLDAFLNERQSLPENNAELIMGALGGRQPGATLTGSAAYRIRMKITLSDGQQKVPEIVIRVSEPGDKIAYRVLAWRDDIGQALGDR